VDDHDVYVYRNVPNTNHLAAPDRVVTSDEGIDIQNAMEVREHDHGRDVQHVLGILTEVRDELDNLGEEDPADKKDKRELARVHVTVREATGEEEPQRAVNEKGRRLELANVNGIETPDVRVVPVSSRLHDTEVATPVATGPAHALVDEHLGAGLKGSQDPGLRVELKSDLEVVVVDPSGKVLVVVMVGSIHKPVVEGVILDERGTVEAGTARESRDGTVNEVGGASVEVTALKVADAQEVDEARDTKPGCVTLNTLRRATSTNKRVLKAREHDVDKLAVGPENVVVSKGDNLTSNSLLKGCNHLGALVEDVNTNDSDIEMLLDVQDLRVDLSDGSFNLADSVVSGDNNDLLGLSGMDALQAAHDLSRVLEDSGNDNTAVDGIECLCAINIMALEIDKGKNVDNEARVAEDTKQEEC
jgi:hypothetical protein